MINKFNKRSQAALEFIILSTVMILVLTISLFLIESRINRKMNSYNQRLANDLLLSISNEFFIASQAVDGYERYFYIPKNLNNQNFSINLSHNELTIIFNDNHYVSFLPFNIYSYSYIGKGLNLLYKKDGVIYIKNLS